MQERVWVLEAAKLKKHHSPVGKHLKSLLCNDHRKVHFESDYRGRKCYLVSLYNAYDDKNAAPQDIHIHCLTDDDNSILFNITTRQQWKNEGKLGEHAAQ